LQPLFHLSWWHWDRIDALLGLQNPSKVVFCCDTERMTWDTFASAVYFLRYALPRVKADYSLWLDQFLLQIPGILPQAFREIFHRELATVEQSDEPRWRQGALFAHPQDVHYDLQNTNEVHTVGRLTTRLSARLANIYWRRCIWNSRKLYKNKDATDHLKRYVHSLGCEDMVLTTWLDYLEQVSRLDNALTNEVILRTIAATKTSRSSTTQEIPYSAYTPLSAESHEIRI